jgi:2-dehydro-3-deoxygalactonokinase
VTPQSSFIAVDWGTSSLRAYRVEDGHVVERRASPDGILTVAAGGFADTLKRALHGWALDAPIVLSGMIGSRQGWKEAPYAPCPASADALAAACLRWREPGLGDIALIPGVSTFDARGVPDVMRGEETQILGAMRALKRTEGLFILPGTHSKRAEVKAGGIVAFSTFMTGELFAALKGHTILGRLMSPDEGDGSGFRLGVEHGAAEGAPGDLMHRLFATRTLGLFDRLPARELADYCSGLLIGAELAASFKGGAKGAVVVGSGALERRYAAAAALLGVTLTPAPEDCVVIGQSAVMERMR